MKYRLSIICSIIAVLMGLVQWCQSGELLPIPLTTVLADETIELWGRSDNVLPHDYSYRWSIVSSSDVIVTGKGFGEWLPSEETVDFPQTIVCTLPSEIAEGTVTLLLEIAHEMIDFKPARLELTVKSKQRLSPQKIVDVKKRQCVLHGLHWLALCQKDDGHWGENLQPILGRTGEIVFEDDLYNEAGSTGFALWAFGAHGFGLSSSGPNPFMECVKKGLAYLAANTVFLPMELSALQIEMNADANSNGRYAVIGRRSNVENYVNPICLSAMVSCGKEDYQVETPIGAMSLSDLVFDAGDFVVKQLSLNGRWFQSWSYYDGCLASSDISISGWNYVALEAMGQWRRIIPTQVYHAVAYTLDSSFDSHRRKFFYNNNSLENASVSIQASALLGIRLILGGERRIPELMTMKTSEMCYDENTREYFYAERADVSLGEAELHVIRHIMEWMETTDCESQGYNLWNAVKALLSCGVTKSPSAHGKYFDWRYGLCQASEDGNDVQRGGVWERIINAQQSNGSWILNSEKTDSQLNDEQVELHAAAMILALSENLFHPVEETGIPIVVQCIIAPGIGEKVHSDTLTSKERLEDGSWKFNWNLTLSAGQSTDFTYSYLVEEAVDGDMNDIQLVGSASWTDESGKKKIRPLEPLSVARIGNGYGLTIAWSGGHQCGGPFEVTVTMALPDSDRIGILAIPPGRTGSVELFATSSLASWLGIQMLDRYAWGAMSDEKQKEKTSIKWITKADTSLATWHFLSDDSFGVGSRGRVFGAELSECLGETLYALLKYNDLPMRLRVMVYPEHGEAFKVLERSLDDNEFGQSEIIKLPVDGNGISPGRILCHAEILRDDELVVMADDEMIVDDFALSDIDASLECVPTEVLRGEALSVLSMVSSLNGQATAVDADVVIFLDDVEVANWQYDGRLVAGRQQRQFLLNTEELEPDTYCLCQQVLSEQHSEPLVTTLEITVLEPKPIKGRFEFPMYELDMDDTIAVNFHVENASNPENIIIEEVQLSEIDVLYLEHVGIENDDSMMFGSVNVKASRNASSEKITTWLTLIDTETNSLLDVASVYVNQNVVAPETNIETEPATETEPDPKPESEPDSESEPETDLAPESGPETEPAPETESGPETESDPETEPKPQPESEPDSEPEPETEPAPESRPETEPDPVTEPEPQPESELDTDPDKKNDEKDTSDDHSINLPDRQQEVEKVYVPVSVSKTLKNQPVQRELTSLNDKQFPKNDVPVMETVAVESPLKQVVIQAKKSPVKWFVAEHSSDNEVHGRFSASSGRLPPWKEKMNNNEGIKPNCGGAGWNWLWNNLENMAAGILGRLVTSEDIVF
ncbi:MAG: hypothetical protein J6X55_11470 [Victivallales bacterium]|nr:hypothetical protein [Victivallales bacterium]